MKAVAATFIELFKRDWNLNANLKELRWDKDFSVLPKAATKFLENDVSECYNQQINKIRMLEVIKDLDSQEKIIKSLKAKEIEVQLSDPTAAAP